MDFRGIEKIVSGGQTGVDRAGLDFAIYYGLDHGGWCPKGRRAEDGRVPEIYNMRESDDISYKKRTRLNVRDSDATLILFHDSLSGGTRLTVKCCKELSKAFFLVDMNDLQLDMADSFGHWLDEHDVKVINIAGPRQSDTQYADARKVLSEIFA